MKRLLLIGGGHSHVEVLRQFAMHPEPGVDIALVTPVPHAAYSGMLPGFIAGHYRRDDIHIDLQSLAARAGSSIRLTAVERIDAEAQVAHCADGSTHPFDVCAIDIGSVPRLDIPGARKHALAVKPVEKFVERWRVLLPALRSHRTGVQSNVAVVGAGAGGVEILLAMQHAATAGDPLRAGSPRFQLLTDTPQILPSHSPCVRRIFDDVLRRRGVTVHRNARVAGVDAGSLRCEDGRAIDADAIVWTISASAAPWIAESGFATDKHGFLRVDRHLQSTSHQSVFGSGDAVAVQGLRLPKSGVFAVRQGPLLAGNLRSALRDEPLRPFMSSSTALNLISTGDRRAVMAWGAFALEGAWVWRWKDAIDRRFIRRYR